MNYLTHDYLYLLAGLEESHNWSGAIAATFQTAGGRPMGRQYRQMPANDWPTDQSRAVLYRLAVI